MQFTYEMEHNNSLRFLETVQHYCDTYLAFSVGVLKFKPTCTLEHDCIKAFNIHEKYKMLFI